MADEFPECYAPAYLHAAEAAQLWSGIAGEDVTVDQYESKCASGELEREGVRLSFGKTGAWLTDLDSLLAYLDRTITDQVARERIEEALEERRLELEGI